MKFKEQVIKDRDNKRDINTTTKHSYINTAPKNRTLSKKELKEYRRVVDKENT